RRVDGSGRNATVEVRAGFAPIAVGGRFAAMLTVVPALAIAMTILSGACVGLLVLARLYTRRSGVDVRVLLGAGPGDIVALWLSELTILSLGGCCLGVIVAWQLARAAVAIVASEAGVLATKFGLDI